VPATSKHEKPCLLQHIQMTF